MRYITFFALVFALACGISLVGCKPRSESRSSGSLDKGTLVPQENLISPNEKIVNSLGMVFVSIPQVGFVCVHETRTVDYMAYARAKKIEYVHAAEGYPPALYGGSIGAIPCTVSWKQAKDFCAWLTEKEGVTYRLLTDREWTVAVGIGDMEFEETALPEKSGKIRTYPWGDYFPPGQRDGNYSALLRGENVGDKNDKDGYPLWAPVMSYAPNRFGLFDMGGNVAEWCEDLFEDSGILRGGSWNSGSEEDVRSSSRFGTDPSDSDDLHGFRCWRAGK